jgi:rod shape-determining protein MreD
MTIPILSFTPPEVPVKFTARVVLYAFALLVVQAHVVSRLPYPALRADLLLPFMFGIASRWSPATGLLWAAVWGFVVDGFSGEFWGLHVGSYMAAVCIVKIASEKFEFENPVYQMVMTGICALGQSVALGLFLSFVPLDAGAVTLIWVGLCIRTLLTMTLAPFVIYPLLHFREDV